MIAIFVDYLIFSPSLKSLINRSEERRVGKECGAEHRFLIRYQFLFVAFGVGDKGFHQRQFQFLNGL